MAISYVHTLDIIYRDLKPENVLLDAQGHIRLTDFGLSKEGISGSSSGANSFCGTPEYLAPEILNRQGHGRAVDWWSLGALLYEMLTGLPPFYCQDRERLFEKIRKSELTYPASLSPNSKSLLRGLLTKNPDKRLGSGPNDADDIKNHPFFANIHWDKLMRGEVKPPWAPQIAGSHDTSQFDKEFTSMPIFSPQSMQVCIDSASSSLPTKKRKCRRMHQDVVSLISLIFSQRGHGFGMTPNGNTNPFEGFTFQDKVFQGPGYAAGH